MRIFIDTEFSDFVDMDLISIGMVAEDGREFYAERSDFDRKKCCEFVQQVILPQLGKQPERMMPTDRMGEEVKEWLLQFKDLQPCICYDYFGDFALLMEIFDRKMPSWLSWQNVWQKIDDLLKERFFMETDMQDHHALNDARANRYAYRPEHNCFSSIEHPEENEKIGRSI